MRNVHPIIAAALAPFAPPLCPECGDTGLGKERDDGGIPSCPFCALGAEREYETHSLYLRRDYVDGQVRLGAVDNRRAK